jgi:hypothetical protein
LSDAIGSPALFGEGLSLMKLVEKFSGVRHDRAI